MIRIYKSTSIEDNKLIELTAIEPGCWINITAPKEQELMLVSKRTGVPLEFMRAAMDDNETSRIDSEDQTLMFLVDIPFTETEENSLTYDTYPLAIIHTADYLITVCLKDSKILQDFSNEKIRTFYTFKKSRFILQILQRISAYYLIFLRQIDKKSVMVEKRLYKSLKNRELIHMLSLQKSLVYFTTSLKSNEVTLDKMLKLELMKRYEEDHELLEDVIIENRQAIEMATIYGDVLAGTMDAFASVISNNLNIVMKFLAAITIMMTVPQIISGYFGMNTGGLPFSESPNGTLIITVIMLAATVFTGLFLSKRDMF
ncbi:magnesium transporter CorA family protein [Proteiniclasticum sp. QWL-01]|uniref:magnesium transporter CorA family protein n=1 Tax=Proteiniclasticum sp. QWL-01 TaxID=3036945 RepID=UPI002203BF91|nr:magnesium transporter CorA family protein [Proteiniclasticum sp. QWL-01]UUM11719.1 magnesium transporter CorA family protein [Clostridiaceae bacterium HFYG-1003]WFF73202.1 magnesium transporter CorA family protein [Proteiniclasticum sp. QWL-01]